jgi:hypothetical protein
VQALWTVFEKFSVMRKLTTLLLLVCLLTVAAWAQQDRTKRVRFAQGDNSASYDDGIARGETLTYVLGAGAGQTMTVTVTSTEDNAVFEVHAPNGNIIGRGVMSEEMDMVWIGRLPQSGDYRVVVGSTRGGSEFNAYFQID